MKFSNKPRFLPSSSSSSFIAHIMIIILLLVLHTTKDEQIYFPLLKIQLMNTINNMKISFWAHSFLLLEIIIVCLPFILFFHFGINRWKGIDMRKHGLQNHYSLARYERCVYERVCAGEPERQWPTEMLRMKHLKWGC